MDKPLILIVEDETIVAHSIKNTLNKLGYEVTNIVTTGKEALKKVEEDNPDLVLMDIVLEGEADGIRTADQILFRYDIPVVFLTAYADKELVERAKKTEPFGYIIKPFEDRELNSVIEIALYKYKMEKKLKESEKRYRELWNNAPVAYHTLNTKGIISSVNQTEAKMLGYSVAELVGKPIFKFILPEQRANARKRFRQKISGQRISREKDRIYVRKGGAQIYVTINDVLERDSNGKITGIRTTMVDITKRVQAGEALKKSEEQFRTSVETLLDGFALFSAIRNSNDRIVDFKYKYINEAGCRLNQRTREEQIGHTLLEMLSLHKDTGLLDEYAQVVETGQPLSKESFVYKDIFGGGKILSRAFDFQAVKFGDGFAVTWRDVTGHKLAEEEIRRSREQLRNLAAHMESLREEERGNIAREIHDELGQSLTGLNMDLSWMEMKLPKDQKPLLDKVQSMTELVGSTIRAVKRISTELRPELLDDLGIAAAVEWQAGEFQNRTGIKCTIQIEPEEIILEKDYSTAIFRIFQETLTNVARHAKATKVNISLKKKEDLVELRVRDNGVGITEEQIYDSKSFGLVGIKERARFLRGKDKIKGERDKGTTITVKIPLPKKEEGSQ